MEQSRRQFLRKVTAGSIVGGGIVSATAGNATAATKTTVEVCGDAWYQISVNDPNASKVSSTTESEDKVDPYSDHSVITGTVYNDGCDKYEFEGQVYKIRVDRQAPDGTDFDGQASFQFTGDLDDRCCAVDAVMEGDGDYWVEFAVDQAPTKADSCEGDDEAGTISGNGYINGYVYDNDEKDVYRDPAGDVTYADLRVQSSGDYDFVKMTRQTD